MTWQTTPRGHIRRLIALAAAVGLAALAAAPAAVAAAPVAQASATAVRVTLADHPADSGTYRASNDGSGESSSGSSTPAVTVLGGQDFLTAGTLVQDATARVVERRGSSAACAGLAGDGASVVAAGDGGCLSGGNGLQLSAGTLDLSNLQLVQSELLEGLDQELQDALAPVIDEVGPALQDGLQQGLRQLGDPGLFLDLGVVQSQCAAGPGTAAGTASIAGTAAYAQVEGTRVDLLRLPVRPAPNTRVATNLSGVAAAVEAALKTQFETALDGMTAPLGDAVDEAAVVNQALAQISAQLAPLEQDVLEVVLNRQVRPSADAITVTALDASVLPAARELGVEALRLEIGESTCGPSGRVAAPPSATPAPKPEAAPAPPTAVPAGVSTAGPADRAGGLSPAGRLALGGLVVVAAAVGAGGLRRSLDG